LRLPDAATFRCPGWGIDLRSRLFTLAPKFGWRSAGGRRLGVRTVLDRRSDVVVPPRPGIGVGRIPVRIRSIVRIVPAVPVAGSVSTIAAIAVIGPRTLGAARENECCRQYHDAHGWWPPTHPPHGPGGMRFGHTKNNARATHSSPARLAAGWPVANTARCARINLVVLRGQVLPPVLLFLPAATGSAHPSRRRSAKQERSRSSPRRIPRRERLGAR